MIVDCNEPPFSLPPPRAMAEALMARAWDDDCPDLERVLLEAAANTITNLLSRLAAVSARDEARRMAAK